MSTPGAARTGAKSGGENMDSYSRPNTEVSLKSNVSNGKDSSALCKKCCMKWITMQK